MFLYAITYDYLRPSPIDRKRDPTDNLAFDSGPCPVVLRFPNSLSLMSKNKAPKHLRKRHHTIYNWDCKYFLF